jgi:hypothetical protein
MSYSREVELVEYIVVPETMEQQISQLSRVEELGPADDLKSKCC